MADIFDYLAWRGDLSWKQSGFNEVDGMILAQLAYVPFEYFTPPLPEGFSSVKELAANALSDERLKTEKRWKQEDDRLLAALADSRRFGGIGVGFAGNRLDEEMQTQFFAVTLKLCDDLFYIAFRGTDSTLVGWKEDLNMSYLCPIPGQKMAVEYVRQIAPVINGRILLGGHSKGGNLAVYAASFCGEEIQDRIGDVYNYDGPGFFDNVLQTDGYRRICSRIHTYVPQFSIVGMLFRREESYGIVHSTETGILQHNLYSWDILGKTFVLRESVTGGSRFVDSTIKDWSMNMTPEQFKSFSDAVYTVLAETNAHTLRELKENWFESAKSIVHSMNGMDNETRAAVTEVLHLFVRSAEKEAKGRNR